MVPGSCHTGSIRNTGRRPIGDTGRRFAGVAPHQLAFRLSRSRSIVDTDLSFRHGSNQLAFCGSCAVRETGRRVNGVAAL